MGWTGTLPPPCVYPDCPHGGVVLPNQPALASGDGRVWAHDDCHLRKLEVIERIREQLAVIRQICQMGDLDPEILAVLHQWEAALARFQVDPDDGTWRVRWRADPPGGPPGEEPYGPDMPSMN